MRLVGFRIKNFKSIKDSGYKNLSPDYITGLIGQNESGKTSILEALEVFSTKKMNKNQFRINTDNSTIYCKFKFNDKNIFNKLTENGYYLPLSLESDLNDGKFSEITLKISFSKVRDENTASYELYEDDPIHDYFKDLLTENLLNLASIFIKSTKTSALVVEKEENLFIKNTEMLLPPIIQKLPIIKFIDNSTILPSSISVREIPLNDKESIIVKDFLEIIKFEVNSAFRYQNDFIEMKNNKDKELKKFNKELKNIWKQYLGDYKEIPKIYFDIESYNSSNIDTKISNAKKIGEPYLKFSIHDKNGYLEISQRSLGFRLYLSIFITLKAAQLKNENRNIVLLLDEPGVNLHPNGQRSLLTLFNELKSDIDVIYTTHSSHLIDIDHIYRILAIESIENEDEEFETKIERYNTPGNTSYDTLLPLYSAIGMNISNQEVIKKNRNLLIEEISAFYYIKTFWKLLSFKNELNILPLSGASKAIDMSLLLFGWGIDHSILVDGDNEGKKVLKKFRDKKIYPEERLLTISCDGIEELFEKKDFEKYIIQESIDENITIKNFMMKNKNKYSKAIIARDFYVRYKNNEFNISSFSEKTIKNFNSICDDIDKSYKIKFILN